MARDMILRATPDKSGKEVILSKKAVLIVLDSVGIGALPDAAAVGQMLDYAGQALTAAGYAPYYLYRQKFMSGGFENVGWTLPGFENLYNICIMEELCSIIAMGGGASTKLVGGGKIRRAFDPKYPQEYIANIDRICENKQIIRAFYEGKTE